MTRDSDDTVDHQRLVKDVEGLRVSPVGVEEEFDDYEEDESQEPVVLGFVKNPENKSSLLPHTFPSKAGGFPAWLDPVDLPTGASSACDVCGRPLQFLLQIYAYLPHKESTFHRTLYVFICTSMACLIQQQRNQQNHHLKKTSQSVKVFRCQLPRVNPYYSYDPPVLGTDDPSGVGVGLCAGVAVGKEIGFAAIVRQHIIVQISIRQVTWSAGHEAECCQTISPRSVDYGSKPVIMNRQGAARNELWPEKEITREDEDESESDRDTSPIKDDIYSYVPNDGLYDYSTSAFMDALELVICFIGLLCMYCRSPGAKPLWPMATGRPSKADIPKCNNCGGDLTYEFQILPQLLYYLGVQNDADSIDWETIAVYTCQASCDGGPSYKDEFAWVQLSSQPTVKP